VAPSAGDAREGAEGAAGMMLNVQTVDQSDQTATILPLTLQKYLVEFESDPTDCDVDVIVVLSYVAVEKSDLSET
jgi:hypothetical protein